MKLLNELYTVSGTKWLLHFSVFNKLLGDRQEVTS